MSAITGRRICWPAPDEVCFQGGCGACNDAPMRDITEVRDKAHELGLVRDYTWGHGRGFCNAIVQRS